MKLKTIEVFGRSVSIILQGTNGPCALIAICNFLILSNRMTLESKNDEVSKMDLFEKLQSMISDRWTDSVNNNDMNSAYEKALEMIPELATGLNINIKFSGAHHFEPVPAIFMALEIPLYHGWVVDPQTDPEIAAVIGSKSYDELMKELAFLSEQTDNSTLSADQGELIKGFLTDKNQMTPSGFSCLQDKLEEGDLCVLFHHNHFATMIKKGSTLYLLATDEGYINLRDLVWEKLNDLNGDTMFMTGNFKKFNMDKNNVMTSTAVQDCHGICLTSVDLPFKADQQFATELQEKELEQPQFAAAFEEWEFSCSSSRKQTKGYRYFYRCTRCGGVGHNADSCPEEACIGCGRLGHNVDTCPFRRFLGHNADACPKACLRCGRLGHTMDLCNEEYLADDLQQTPCSVCQRLGHLSCGNIPDIPAAPTEISCYRCGELGHVGSDCKKNPWKNCDAPTEQIQIQVPKEKVKLIIGKHGGTIKGLQTKTGARIELILQVTGDRMQIELAQELIKEILSRAAAGGSSTTVGSEQIQIQVPNKKVIPQQIDVSTDTTVQVTGDEKQIEITQESIKEVLSRAGPGGYSSTVGSGQIKVPNAKVGLIIGRSGRTIKDLETAAGARFKVIAPQDGSTEATVQVKGDTEQIKRAQEFIKEFLSRADARGSPSTVVSEKIQIQVPTAKVGLIIGKKGRTINGLQIETGARVEVIPPQGDVSTDTTVQVTGDKKQIELAQELIKEILSRDDAGGSPSTVGSEKIQLEVPNAKMGLIIGSGGRTFKDLETATGAHFKVIRQPGGGSKESTVQITGDKKQIELAQILIKRMITPYWLPDEALNLQQKRISATLPQLCDSEETVLQKVTKLYCPPRIVDNNPCLGLIRLLVFPKFSMFTVERDEDNGGNRTFNNYEELFAEYESGQLKPKDLKTALASALNRILEPVRVNLANDTIAKELLERVRDSLRKFSKQPKK